MDYTKLSLTDCINLACSEFGLENPHTIAIARLVDLVADGYLTKDEATPMAQIIYQPKGGTKESDKLVRRLEREIEKQEKIVAEFDGKIEAASADYQELTRLLGEKEEAEMVLMDLMEQWENAQEG